LRFKLPISLFGVMRLATFGVIVVAFNEEEMHLKLDFELYDTTVNDVLRIHDQKGDDVWQRFMPS
jgi:hypothetical protein